jgi:choline kinase
MTQSIVESSGVAAAILLAAGVSRRLRPYVEDRPKCLLEMGGVTLFERHVFNLARLGVPRLIVVTGYRAEQLNHRYPEGVAVGARRMAVSFAHNAEYEKGSILSLRTGLDALEEARERGEVSAGDVVVMDADVLYHPHVLERLVRGRGSLFLLDETSRETGEEMMLGARAGLVRRVARSVAGESWDEVGETVGFFRVSGADQLQLRREIDAVVEAGGERHEYEAAVQRVLDQNPAPYVRVGDLPWTEIDFKEDVERARDVILPRVLAAEGDWRKGAV